MSARRRERRARIGLGALLAVAQIACGGALPRSRDGDAGAGTDIIAPADAPSDPDVVEAAAPDGPADAVSSDGAADATDAADGPTRHYRIAAGAYHLCAWRDSDLLCWGRNHAGELGTGDQSDWQGPTRVVGISDVKAVAVGDAHTCAVDGGGHVLCWGDNTYGQLGDGTTEARLQPTAVAALEGAIQVGAGRGHTCAVTAAGQVFCWGDDCCAQLGTAGNNLIPQRVTGIANAVEISAGYVHTCARRSDGRVSCWGPNSYGEIGNGTNLVAPGPTNVSGLPAPAAQIASGPFHNCARLTDGQTFCWGRGMNGMLGDGTQADHNLPQPVAMPEGDTAAQLAAGLASCARLGTGRLACWGTNAGGALGDGTTVALRDHPGLIPGFSGAVDLAGLCAVSGGGDVVCWGPNGTGQVGDGTRVDRNQPTAVVGLP